MAEDQEFLSPEDFGAMTRADHARKATEEHFQYLISRLFAKLKLEPDIDFIEPDGRITRTLRT